MRRMCCWHFVQGVYNVQCTTLCTIQCAHCVQWRVAPNQSWMLSWGPNTASLARNWQNFFLFVIESFETQGVVPSTGMKDSHSLITLPLGCLESGNLLLQVMGKNSKKIAKCRGVSDKDKCALSVQFMMIITIFHVKWVYPSNRPFQNWSAICWIPPFELQFDGRQNQLTDAHTHFLHDCAIYQLQIARKRKGIESGLVHLPLSPFYIKPSPHT